MLAYIIPLFICILAIIQYDVGNHKTYRHIAWFALFVYAVLLSGLRYRVGGDTITYMADYDRLPTLDDFSFFENTLGYQPLYRLLCAICRSISDEFYVLQFFHALLVNSCIFYFIHSRTKDTGYRFTALLLYFFLYYLMYNMEVMRESLAIGVFLVNYKSLERRQWIRYGIGVFIAVLFHVSALILVFFPFIRFVKLNRMYFILLAALLGVLMLISRYLYILSMMDGIIAGKVTYYTSNTELVNVKWLIYNLITLFLCPFSLLLYQKYGLKDKSPYESHVCVFCLFGIGTIILKVIFARFTNYLMPFYALFLAHLLYSCYKANLSRKLFASLCYVMIFFVYGHHYLSYQYYFPYYSIITMQTDPTREKLRGGN